MRKMMKYLAIAGCSALVGMFGGRWIVGIAFAANTSTPAWTVEAVNVDVAATPLPITIMNGREGVEIFNDGPNKIWCGSTSAVTSATGRPIPAGGSWGLSLSYTRGSVETTIYCITTALQVSPVNTRVTQVR